ncbi:transglutaminase family protein [Desulforhopalus sp. IMCC35007]|uniref:transglutaminase family protein n=1 Tax=Desulforhopalus sp. IMCC35007 TaxID=2569543 RepID=UPI0010ADC392|nr:transglutaminase family protein [Desulforhopalus sp. IMCC35007]TKB08625.1 transglutaminase family protein [Desulforhopalus sp. IMCC35007]
MIYRVTHNTGYKYSLPASLSQNELFLFPRNTPSQEVIESRLIIDPQPQYLHSRTDYFGNTAHVFMVQHPHDALAISVTSLVKTSKPVVPAPCNTMPWEKVVQRLISPAGPLDLDAQQFVFSSPLVSYDSDFVNYVRPSFSSDTPVLVGAADLVQRIFREFAYDKLASNVETTVKQVLSNRKGVCQDFALVAISCLRSLGLAARYVSGYLETFPPPGKPKLVGSDASHAWISVYIPDFGWVDLDPTNNLIANETYITVAWGRDYGDVSPVKGVVMGGGLHVLSVMVDVSAQKEQ